VIEAEGISQGKSLGDHSGQPTWRCAAGPATLPACRHEAPIVMFNGIHHAAIICSDYARSKRFYTDVLGLEIVAENYRVERDSHKLDLSLPDG